MINYISQDNVIIEIKKYINTLKEEEIEYYMLSPDIEKYIFKNTFNFKNLLKKYIIKINQLLNCYDSELFILDGCKNNWNLCIINDGLFFEDIFVLKNIIFIRFSKIIDIVELRLKKELNIDFIEKLMKSRIYVIQYYNFYKWIEHIENNNNCKIVKKINFIQNNDFCILKDINISFMDNYYCIFGEDIEYIIVNKIINSGDNDSKYFSYYDTKIIKVNDNIIDFDEIIENVNIENFTNYFKEYNDSIIENIMENL
jgi:hypothetical protein